MWHCVEQGQGRPLVLLHGIGMSSAAWKPVMSRLAQQRRVIAFDVAGFGRSPLLAPHITPTTPHLAQALGDELRQMGIEEPVDMVGNSMGGWMALEAARLGMARSVVAISPAGLWVKPPAHIKHIFFTIRSCTRAAPSMVAALLRVGILREALMALPLTTGSMRMPAEEAIAAALDFVHAPSFEETFAHAERFRDGQLMTVPVTVAFGTHDWLITPSARLRDELPPHVRWLEPRGWGHVPMWKDPEGVAELILEGTR
jgi:pimeloyl-ACP methyl ester carboxylesterase